LIISFVVAPIDLEASISPSSTSFNAPSIILATNGAAPNERGTINATLPKDFPIRSLDKGIKRTIRITKGIDLVIFTSSTSRILCNVLLGFTPLGSEVTRSTPIGSPIIKETSVAIATI